MRYLTSFFFVLILLVSNAQSNELDDKYLEDQFYLSLHYNSLRNSPSNFNQNKFSSTLSFGFIRDIPLNQRRNFGLGLGFGLALSSINSNLKLNDFNNNIEGLIVAADSFDKNKWNSSRLEIPLEIRWRISTASTYKFWRVYFGLKTSFLLNSKYKFESENSSYKLNSLPLRKIQSGLMLNAGNNTWNLGLYMGLNPIFNDEFGKNNMEIKDLKEFTLGLTFYIL